MGIEYTFNNTWARTGSSLYDGTALFISTRKTGTVFNTAQSELLLSNNCLLYTSPSPRDGLLSRMPSSA